MLASCRHAMRFSSSVSGNAKALKSKISTSSSSSSSRSANVSLFVVRASSSSDDDKPKVKSYLDAGKKTKTSVGLRNSFYDRFPPVLKSSKTGTQFLRRGDKKKFQAPKKKRTAKNASKPISLMNPIKIAASPAKKKNKPISFSATVKPKKKAFFATPKVKTVAAKKSKEAYTPFPALKRKRSGPPVKSQYTIKKQPIKPVKQIVNSRGKVAAKAPATKRAQTVVFSNMFASLRGEKKSAPAAAAPVAKIALPVQMKKKEEQPEKKKAANSYSASSMSKDEIGTYGLIAAFSLASFSSLVVLPVALGDVFELIGFGVSAYFLFSLLVKDDDLGLSKTLDEVESQTGLDVRELTNSTVGLVKDTVSTVSSNTKKTSYPKKSESPNPVVAAVESPEKPKEEEKVNEEGSEAE
jgi:hypothetical protein